MRYSLVIISVMLLAGCGGGDGSSRGNPIMNWGAGGEDAVGGSDNRGTAGGGSDSVGGSVADGSTGGRDVAGGSDSQGDTTTYPGNESGSSSGGATRVDSDPNASGGTPPIEDFVPVKEPMLSNGYFWIDARDNVMTEQTFFDHFASLGDPLGCYAGTLGASADAFLLIGLDINHNAIQEGNYAPPDAAEGGIQVIVMNDKPDSELKISLVSKLTDGRLLYWCTPQPVALDGTTVPWSNFSSGCPATDQPYGGQPIHSIRVIARGNGSTPVPYRFCIDSFRIVE